MFTTAAAFTAATLPVCYAFACIYTPARACALCYAYIAPTAATDDDDDNNNNKEGEGEEEKKKGGEEEGEREEEALPAYVCSRPRRH